MTAPLWKQSGARAIACSTGADPISARRSIFSRVVWWAIAASAAVVLVLWVLTFSTISAMADGAAERAVDVDLAGLVDIYASGGQAELESRIKDRLALTPSTGNSPHYLLADNAGTRLAGDLDEWPPLRARLSEAGEVQFADGRTAFARATQIGPDLRLLVAREDGDTAALQRRIGIVFLVGGTLLILAVGLLGRRATRRLATRIVRVNDALRDPDTDDLARFVATKHPDEIDELTERSGKALARMKLLMEAHRETSDQIAHEIRTPLMHIDSKLVKALNDIGAAAPHLMTARDDIKRLVHMLESLLDIASSKARQGDRLGLRPVDLSGLCLRLGELYADSAEESGHHFECRIAPDVTVSGEEMHLTRLITNLLDNAFKYVPGGGTVALVLEPGPVLSVEDDGPGIPAGQRASIFERFQRGGSSSGQGAGLGLALARAIAERHGWTLTLDTAHKGARFVAKEGGSDD